MERPALHPGLSIGDALELPDLWQGVPPPSSIITSPPYLDMHDYGNASQIGVRGQRLEQYLQQMLGVFRDCHKIAKADATFWLVAGCVRRGGRLIPLPDKLATCADEAGWVLREVVTWDKQKALPWTHHGELRDITEQVMLFSKMTTFTFDPNDIRSPIPNSNWWRRYPERYSPDGSMPTNLWSIPIPTQGSWTGVRTHFCPFPEELTYRLLSLTTVKGDVVLDPMAGIGSVPAMAEAMGRIGYGLELTAEYTKSYARTLQSAKGFLRSIHNDANDRDDFRRTIIELRLLKYAKLVGKYVKEAGFPVSWVRVEESTRRPEPDYKIISGDLELVVSDMSLGKQALAKANAVSQRPPLSKFGIDAEFVLVDLGDAAKDGYWYSSGRFWNTPSAIQPPSGEPHVVTSLRPDPDKIDDTPYI